MLCYRAVFHDFGVPVLIALFADIHGNRQAFEACLAHARTHGAEQFALLGDFVGYGADPAWAVETAMALVKGGAIAVLGNHDSAVSSPQGSMNLEARVAIDWTRGKLGVAEREFLANLPLTVTSGHYLFVHAEASAPRRWIYVLNAEDAARSLRGTNARITFCGHVHTPTIYSVTPAAKLTVFVPHAGVPVPLHGLRRWLVVLGSVGQPRDGNPGASYAMLDTSKDEITFHRVAYDIQAAADAILENGLPPWLAERLFLGR